MVVANNLRNITVTMVSLRRFQLKSLLGRFTVNKVNFFLDEENNSKNLETKFHDRRISIDEVMKSINVNFLFFRSIFFY